MPFPSGPVVRNPTLAAAPRSPARTMLAPGADDSPAPGSPAAGSPAAGSPAAGSPAAGSLAAGSLAAGSLASGSLAAGSPAARSRVGGERGTGAAGGFRFVLGPCLALLAILAAAPRTDAQTTMVLKSLKVTLPTSTARFPAGAGADVAEANCLACHSVGMILNQPVMPRAAWEAEVNKMRNVYKAPVEASSVAAITDYLTSIKGPKQ